MTLADAGADERLDEVIAWLGPDETASSVALSYLSSRARVEGLPWVVSLLARHPALTAPTQGQLLACLQNFEAASIEAERRCAEVEREYWLRFSYYGHDEESSLLSKIAGKLCDVGRHTSALERLSYHLNDEARSPDLPEIVVTAFERFIDSAPEDRDGRSLDEYHVTQLLSFIGCHATEIGEVRVTRIEWSFLSHSGLDVSTMALHRALSTSPEFFVEIVSLAYRRQRQDPDDPPEEPDPTNALKAYRLLDSWALPPGMDSDGNTDAKSCGDWIEAAKELLQTADRFEVGMDHIGKALSNWSDGDTEWPSLGVAETIEQVAEDRIDGGVRRGLIAQRGASTRGIGDGGEQERGLAYSFRKRAAPFHGSHPRVARILNDVARSWEAQGRVEDAESERDLRGLD